MNPRPSWRSRTAPVAAVVAAVLVLTMLTTGASGPFAAVVPPLIGGGAVAVAVWAVLRRRAERAAYEQRLTAWAALDERLRIARDLHDLVSHGLGLITVRAAATHHLPQSPEVRAALGDIEAASREATGELRRMLGVLRTPATLEPPAGLSSLPSLVAAFPHATLHLADPGPVPPGVQVAVCRIVREALTNTARHAGPVPARVSVRRDGPLVVVTVADDGPAPGWRPAPGAGHGLAGLREWAGSLAGTLAAGPVDGGFRLTARIPA